MGLVAPKFSTLKVFESRGFWLVPSIFHFTSAEAIQKIQILKVYWSVLHHSLSPRMNLIGICYIDYFHTQYLYIEDLKLSFADAMQKSKLYQLVSELILFFSMNACISYRGRSKTSTPESETDNGFEGMHTRGCQSLRENNLNT